MSSNARSAQLRLLRRMALLLALICFWISGGAALHHTDDVTTMQTFPVSRSILGHAAAPTLLAPCAACEWQQALSTPPAPAMGVAYLPIARVLFTAPCSAALHLLPFDHLPLRGPPSVS